MSTRQHLIIDADDTLWENNIYFERAFGEFAAFLDHSALTPRQVRDVLDEIAGRDGLTVVQLIEKLYDELIAARGEAGNFASFLRVSALRYQALLAHQAIPADVAVPLRGLDARAAVQKLPAHWQGHGGRTLRPGLQGPQAPSSSARSCAAEKSSAPV